MIQAIEWPDHRIGELRSPFDVGGNEPKLRITIHVEAFNNLSAEDESSYFAVRELGELDCIEIFATQVDSFPYLEINPSPSDDGYRNVKIFQNGEIISYHHGVNPTRINQLRIHRLIGFNADKELYKTAENDILAVEAHHALGRDIFVTTSQLLLAHRMRISYANIRTPIEAARIVGLFLRSQNNWIYSRIGRATYNTDKGMFYWVLARSKLPAMWRYFSGCVYARKNFGEEILYIGQSVLERCTRALQARDAIGIQFYRTQNNNTQDEIMYHFDYLTLLISGAFDAQANIANYVYSLLENNFNVGFRKKKFLKGLCESKADNLYELVTSDRCEHLMTMLHTLRNTIHSAGLKTYTFAKAAETTKSYVEIPEDIRDFLWQSSLTMGTAEEWGLIRDEYSIVDPKSKALVPKVKISLEPYTYVTKLIDTWFQLFNNVAQMTEIEGLFPVEEVPQLADRPPDDWESMIVRFSLLA